MSQNTNIEWADATWNPTSGCSRKSPGCENCYAEKMTKRLAAMGLEKYQGLLNEHDRFNGVMKFDEEALLAPLKWKKPRRVFVNSMSDLFHENAKDEWIDKVFAVMALTPHITYQILTKRPERMKAYFSYPKIGHIAFQAKRLRNERGVTFPNADFQTEPLGYGDPGAEWFPLKNVHLGTSVEVKKTKPRIDILREMPAAIRFLSIEPLLEDLGELNLDGIDWVIVGGESGPNARPLHPDWVRSIRDQCQAAGVPFFFKQWGEWVPWDFDLDWHPNGLASHTFGDVPNEESVFRRGKKKAGRLLDGREWNEFPEVMK